jgi:UPF0755 protein
MKRYGFMIAALVVVIAGLGIGVVAWYKLQLRAVAPGSTKQQIFSIKSGEGAREVSRRLASEGLVRSYDATIIYLTLHGNRAGLKVGSFEVSAGQSTPELLGVIVEGRLKIKRLTIPEGTVLVRIETLVSEQGISRSNFDQALSKDHSDNAVLATRPPGSSMEGYLFPDTYNIAPDTTADALVRSMLDNLKVKLTPDILDGFKAQGLTVHQGLTLASIIEKEAFRDQDRAGVAQVFVRRLALKKPFESDAIVQYAIDLNAQAGKGTLPVTTAIQSLNSPYNSYKFAGLPPGPICNPGIESIKAAAHPATTDYLFFLADKDGVTHFAKTFEEHQANIVKYLK